MRPISFLADVSRRYPRAWERIEEFRRGRGKDLPSWPDWCYCPMAAAYAIVSGGGENRCDLSNVKYVSAIAALAPWRLTQGVYRFDPDLRAALLDTGTEDVPSDMFYRLPEWCVYLELDGYRIGNVALDGFFAHLEFDTNTRRTELRLLLLPREGDAIAIPLHLISTNIPEMLRAMEAEAVKNAGFAVGLSTAEATEEFAMALSPLLSLLLYLCSDQPDISGGSEWPPRKVQIKRHPKSDKVLQAKRPEFWKTGFDLGQRLRAAAQEETQPDGRKVRPHVRRAHWHTYLTGPRKESERSLRWISPILVSGGPDRATIKEVK